MKSCAIMDGGGMEKKAVICAAVCAAAAVGGIAAWAAARTAERTDPCAAVYSDGKLAAYLPLDEDAELRVECAGGYNVIRVENGAVRVCEADCPDKVCVDAGGISGGAVPIVCLPHRLEVRVINGADAVDAAVG